MSRPWPLLLLLAVLCLIRVGSGTGALGWGTVLPGFTCYRPLGAPARFLWPPFSAANRHRPPPAHRADACICRCHAIGYFFAVFIRRAQPLPGGGGPSNCFCMNHWNKKLTEVGAQHCRSRPDFWVAYKLMGNPKLASHCRGARVIRKRPPPTTRRPRRTPPTQPPNRRRKTPPTPPRRRRTPPTPPRRRTPPTRRPTRRRTPPTPPRRRRTPPTPPRKPKTPPTPPRKRTPPTTPRRQKTPPTGYPKHWPKKPKHPPTRPHTPPPGKRSGGERGGPPPSSGTYGVYPSRPDGKVTYPCQPGSSHCPPGSHTVQPRQYHGYQGTQYPVYQEPYRGHNSQPPCDHCARSSSDRGPHVVHVFHHGAPTRPPSVQHVHINVHQNQLQNVQARGGSGSGSGGGATAGAASNAVVNVHVNGQGGRPAGRGGTVVNNSLGSRLAATAAGAGPGGQPSEAGAVQTASSKSSAGTGEHGGVEKRAGPCGGAPGGCGSCCKY
ncbi:basic salivary proline-rich protein 2-like [Amphibalanus amphitrite]|uniref:basic salivary proline-rich protein 2-like n=1 Tax=Amphibalanus amphitrite TaxID=1232801 RepID=UPI001C90DB1B|nr:basic salivary proline-rich protein 2-like [Amphibalanus amphitrite]